VRLAAAPASERLSDKSFITNAAVLHSQSSLLYATPRHLVQVIFTSSDVRRNTRAKGYTFTTAAASYRAF